MNQKSIKYIIILLQFSLSISSFAHSGRTNSDGCHIQHTTSAWCSASGCEPEYHCHSAPSALNSATSYCLVVNFQKYCGYAASTCNQLKRKYGGFCTVDF